MIEKLKDIFPEVKLNDKLSMDQLKDKIKEESLEVAQAFESGDLNNLSEELLDLAQVAINAHRQLVKRTNMNCDVELQKHNYKLKTKGLING